MKTNRIVAFVRYIYAYFHIHIIMFLSIFLMIIYYVISINNRSYYINDSYISNILDSRFEYNDVESLSSENYKSNSILLIGAINYNIKQGSYDKAIEMIERVKKSINPNITFYKYLSIRQALLYINLVDDFESYKQIVLSKYPYLGERVIKSILSVFRLRKDN